MSVFLLPVIPDCGAVASPESMSPVLGLWIPGSTFSHRLGLAAEHHHTDNR